MESWEFGRPVAGYRAEVSGARAVVLLVHGYGEHAGRYAHVIDALGAAGFSVFTYDQRGHGRSTGPRALFRMHDLTEDHLAAREWLRQRFPHLPVFALGHSMGGLVTALSVLRDARSLTGVILSSPALMVGHDHPPAMKVAARVLSRVAPSMQVSAVEDGVLSRREEIGAAFKSDELCYNGRVKALSGFEMMRGGAEVWGRLGRWHLPTLVIHGDDDRLITIEGSRRFVRDVPATDKELWEAPGGYHELFNDLDSEKAIRKVTDWLAARVDGVRREPVPSGGAAGR